MDFLRVINEQFESLYTDKELNLGKVEISVNDIEKLNEFSNMPLPNMLLDILKTGISFGIVTKEKNKVIQLLNVVDILDDEIYYPYFKEDIKKGIIFGNDLGSNIYFYGEGKKGMGIYAVDGTVESYFDYAVKLADTFEEFFIKGIGVDVLNRGIIV